MCNQQTKEIVSLRTISKQADLKENGQKITSHSDEQDNRDFLEINRDLKNNVGSILGSILSTNGAEIDNAFCKEHPKITNLTVFRLNCLKKRSNQNNN